MLQATPAPDPTKAKVEPERPGDEEYDPRKRDPQYAHASKSPLWELVRLQLLSWNRDVIDFVT